MKLRRLALFFLVSSTLALADAPKGPNETKRVLRDAKDAPAQDSKDQGSAASKPSKPDSGADSKKKQK